ncbi:MAG: hypothetical protein FJZ01_20315 [Candidatus Sericytochromatia bacterium]|nr:hypothetical protein [Candidatus Tanganyikabacteria bacterium]
MALGSVVSLWIWGALVASLLALGYSLAPAFRVAPAAEPALRAPRIWNAVLVLGWAGAAWWLAPAGKTWPLAIAVVAGGAIAGLIALGPLREESRLRAPGGFAAVVAAFAIAALATGGDAAARQWAALGLPLGMALPALTAGVFRREAEAFAGALAAGQATALAGALIWADRIYPAHQVGTGAVLGFAGAVALLMALAAFALSAQPARAPVAAGALAALAAYLLVALALRQPHLAIPAAIGAGMAALLALGAGLAGPPEEEPPALVAVLLLVLAGGTLLLINRLYGMPGLGMCGIGLAALATADNRATRWLAALLPAAFGARALLHLFLDRTYLRVEGVDVTQTYAFAALILGFVVATALVRFRAELAADAWSGGAAAGLLAATPVLVGYLIHILPLAGFLAGLIAAGFALAALCDGLEEGAARLAPYLGLACAGAAAAAPFLTEVINAPRVQRAIVFAVVTGIASWYVVSTLRSQSRPAAA